MKFQLLAASSWDHVFVTWFNVEKQDELKQLLGEAAAINLMSLMGANGTQQKQRQNERQQKREERKSQGMSDEEILKLEAEEDVQAEEEALKKSTGSTVQDLEVNMSVYRKFLDQICTWQQRREKILEVIQHRLFSFMKWVDTVNWPP